MCRLLHSVSAGALKKHPIMCLFPTCDRHPESNKFCVFHKMYANTVVPKPLKAIAKRSKKMKAEMDIAKPEYQKFLLINPICNIQSPECTIKATCINHTKGRGKELLNKEFWEASCMRCNSYIEENHKWGQERGHKLSRHTGQETKNQRHAG